MADFAIGGDKKLGLIPVTMDATTSFVELQRELAGWLAQNPPTITKQWVHHRDPVPITPSMGDGVAGTTHRGSLLDWPQDHDARIRDYVRDYGHHSWNRSGEPVTTTPDNVLRTLLNGPEMFPIDPQK